MREHEVARNYNNAGANATAMPAVYVAQETLDRSLESLHHELEDLANRLQPVLGMPRPQEVVSGPRTEKEPNTPNVANRINGSADIVRAVASRIRDLRERLEV